MILLSDEVADLPTPTGPMRIYVCRPVSAGRYPGVVLFSEIFQVTPPVRRIADEICSPRTVREEIVADALVDLSVIIRSSAFASE